MCNCATIIALCTLLLFITTTTGEINGTVSEKSSTSPKPGNDLCLTSACIRSALMIRKNMNSSVKPCDDFYEFACGKFGEFTTIPGKQIPESTFDEATDDVLFRLRKIIEGIEESNAPKHFKLVKTHYENCMKRASSKTGNHSKMTSAVNDILTRNGWPLLYGEGWSDSNFDKSWTLLHLFDFHQAPDISDATVWIPELTEKEPPLHRNYLMEGFSNEVVQAYYRYMVEVAVAFGIDKSAAEISLNETLQLEIELFQVVFTDDSYFDFYDRYSKTTLEELERKYPNLPFTRIFSKSSNPIIQINVDEVTLERVNNWIARKSKRALANWEAWRHIAKEAPHLTDYVVRRTEVFNRISEGDTRNGTKWEQCVQSTMQSLGFALGALYQRQYISQSSVDDLIAMLDKIKQKLSEFIEKAEWLGVETKRNALEKVSTIKSSLSTCRDFILDDELEIFYRDLELSDSSNPESSDSEPKIPTSRDMCGQFLMASEYLPASNFLQLSAEVFTDLFHNINRPKYLNYGTAGTIIGHEIAHSLGVEDRYLDKNGALKSSWDSESNAKYINHTRCLIDQYGKYTIDNLKMHVNGLSTVNENIADNMGAKAVYYAYVEWANGREPEKSLVGLDYSPNQMFWISMASSYCEKYRPEYVKSGIYVDVHSPNKFRINGPLSNIQEFSNDFKCDLGTRMNPVRKCNLL